MSKVSLKQPRYQNDAEGVQTVRQESFSGMFLGAPLSELTQAESHKNVNVIDYGRWAAVRPGSRRYTSATVPDGILWARHQHAKSGLVVMQVGQAVYVADPDLRAFSLVFMQSAGNPPDADFGTIVSYGDDAILVNGACYLIRLSEEPYIAYRISIPVPVDVIRSYDETAENTYGYNYLTSFSRFDGLYSGSRLSDPEETAIKLETGTTKLNDDDVDYATVFTAVPVGDDSSRLALGPLKVPSGAVEVTHHTVYRTKNIGTKSGGRRYNAGIWVGNRPDFPVFCKDIPVARVLKVTISDNISGQIATISGEGRYDTCDRQCVYSDVYGNSLLITGSDDSAYYVSGISPATWGLGTHYIFTGSGRVGIGAISGGVLSCSSSFPFEASDVGRPVFLSNDRVTYITAFNSNSSVDILDDDISESEVGFTLGVADSVALKTYEFSRNFYDTTPDNNVSDASSTLDSRIASKRPLFFPRRFCEPFEPSNVAILDYGAFIVTKRDGSEYEYCSTADKPYSICYCRKDFQKVRVDGGVTAIASFNGSAGIFGKSSTRSLALTKYTDKGNKEVQEFVMVLDEARVVSRETGVRLWKLLAFVPGAGIVAVTNEPAVRIFNGSSWGSDYSVGQSGIDAVGPLIRKIDSRYPMAATYSREDGLLFWFYALEEVVEDDNVIQDTAGTEITGSDVWQDNGGTEIPAADIIQNTAGIV